MSLPVSHQIPTASIMANNETVHRTELSKIVDDGINNNYDEWKTKSYHKLREWGLLKYIEGPDSDSPVDPPLRETVEYHGLDSPFPLYVCLAMPPNTHKPLRTPNPG